MQLCVACRRRAPARASLWGCVLLCFVVVTGVQAAPAPTAPPRPVPESKPPTLTELIALLDADIQKSMQEDVQLAQEARRLRAEQLIITSQEEQLKAAQDRLRPQIKDAQSELAKVLEKLRQLQVGIDAWNNRCAEDVVGPLPTQAYDKCMAERAILENHANQYTATRDRWQREVDRLQAQFDKYEVQFRGLVGQWDARDRRLKDIAKRRAAIVTYIQRLKQVRAKMVAAKCPAAKTGTEEELKLKCGNVQFDAADPNMPSLEEICPTCVMPPGGYVPVRQAALGLRGGRQ